MRAEVQTIVDEIKQSIGCEEASLTSTRRAQRLSELNKQAEDPARGTISTAPRVMQERTALEEHS
jgi:hypothetical protein